MRRLFVLCPSLLLAVSGWAGPRQPAGALAYPDPGAGSIEFTVRPRTEKFPMRKDLLLLAAGSSDGSQRYEIHVAAEDLLVLREFGRCIRSAGRMPHNFKKGLPYRLTLKWSGESTAFSVNGQAMDEFNLMVVDKFRGFQPSLSLESGTEFELSDAAVLAGSDLAVDPEDRRFAQEHLCPDLASLLGTPAQETFRGVELHRFPDPKAAGQVKGYISLLTEGMAGSLKHVIYVEKSYNPDSSWHGMALQGAGTMLVQEVSFKSPRTFCHEAAHLYDHQGTLTEKVLRSQAWKERFMREAKPDPAPRRGHSVLDLWDASSAHEELADFVGLVYEDFLKPKSRGRNAFFEERENKAKLAFLLEQGFIDQKVYDRVAAPEER